MSESASHMRQPARPARNTVAAVARRVATLQGVIARTLSRLTDLTPDPEDRRPRRDGTEHLM